MGESAQIDALERVSVGGTAASAKEFIESFDFDLVPTASGCYIMRDTKDRILYIGKAKNLRARVRAYINETDSRYQIAFLMRRVVHIDFLVTSNEKEAVLLENSLIKQHKPRYNVMLRDDKTYVSLRVNVQHKFPRVMVTRKLRKDGARYFGPYSSAGATRETLRTLQRIFPLRTCSDNVLNNRARPCLYYQMKRCCAPCVDYVTQEEYREFVDQVLLFLAGRNADVERKLVERIEKLAEALEFEKAAEVRDRLYALRRTLERQRTVNVPGAGDRDVFGVHTEGRFCEIQVLFFRSGKMTGGRSYSFNRRETPLEEVVSSFLLQYYADGPGIPAEVLVPVPLEEAETLSDIFTEAREAKVTVHHPQRGDKRALVDMANRNARKGFDEKRLKEQAEKDLLNQLREQLKLPKPPHRVECFDISTTQGAKPVGSMVVFEGAQANKSRYRHYAIKEVEGQDDFAMMREVLMRRFKRAIDEDDLPDLVVIDGGKGQLNVATAVFKDLGIEDLPAVGLAKSRAQGDSSRSPERFFLPGRMNPIILPQHGQVVRFMARVRDEAHRFAITYHRKRRGKSVISTRLTEIPGIGPKRAKTLLNRLGSLTKVREAAVEEIAAVPGFNRKLAETVKQALADSQDTSGDTE
jgi:excinuclease ABC subunit C